MRTAMRETAQDAAEEIEYLGRDDISHAGNFGSRWLTGLHADISEGGGNIRVDVKHDVPYFIVFEEGRVIHGKPMLWIPLSFANVPRGMWARDYPDPLFRVDRIVGAPLLLSIADKKPKFFGKESVTIPQKFHIREIARGVAKRVPQYYRDRFARG